MGGGGGRKEGKRERGGGGEGGRERERGVGREGGTERNAGEISMFQLIYLHVFACVQLCGSTCGMQSSAILMRFCLL